MLIFLKLNFEQDMVILVPSHLLWVNKSANAFYRTYESSFRNYLDLFVIFFIHKSESGHMKNLRILLNVLKDNKLFANFSE